MPELPELEAVKDVLSRHLAGRTLVRVEIAPRGGPIVVRDLTGEGISAQLTGRRVDAVERRGKYLLFHLSPRRAAESPIVMAINPKLTGRLQLCPPDAPKAGPVHLTYHFDGLAHVLRYIDSKRMVIRIEQGKGNKDRYVMLSPHLLELLRAWYKVARPQGWLFPGMNPVNPMTTRQFRRACHAAARMAERWGVHDIVNESDETLTGAVQQLLAQDRGRNPFLVKKSL